MFQPVRRHDQIAKASTMRLDRSFDSKPPSSNSQDVKRCPCRLRDRKTGAAARSKATVVSARCLSPSSRPSDADFSPDFKTPSTAPNMIPPTKLPGVAPLSGNRITPSWRHLVSKADGQRSLVSQCESFFRKGCDRRRLRRGKRHRIW